MDIVVERVFVDPQEENDKWQRTLSENSEASSPKNRRAILVELLKSRRLINDQVLGKKLFNSMSMSKKRLELDED